MTADLPTAIGNLKAAARHLRRAAEELEKEPAVGNFADELREFVNQARRTYS